MTTETKTIALWIALIMVCAMIGNKIGTLIFMAMGPAALILIPVMVWFLYLTLKQE